MRKFRLTNMHGTIIWEGEAVSFYQAWQHMFNRCGYPQEARIISKEIDGGIWCEAL